MSTKRISDFKSFINEKDTSKLNMIKYDKLIKELERINSKGNEDVKQAIASLKRGRDLKESPELIDLLLKVIDDAPETLVETINMYIEV